MFKYWGKVKQYKSNQTVIIFFQAGNNNRQEVRKSLEKFTLRLFTQKENLKKHIGTKFQQLIECKAEGEKMIKSGHYPCDKVRFFQYFMAYDISIELKPNSYVYCKNLIKMGYS